MEIRKATEQDIAQLVECWLRMMQEHQEFEPRIEMSSMADASYQSYLMLHLRSGKSRILVLVEEDGSIKGFICAYICQNLPMFLPAEFGYVSDLYVEPDYAGQGWGSKLMDETSAWFRKVGQTCVQLQVYDKNKRGKKFWETRGYQPFFERMWINLEEEQEKD